LKFLFSNDYYIFLIFVSFVIFIYRKLQVEQNGKFFLHFVDLSHVQEKFVKIFEFLNVKERENFLYKIIFLNVLTIFFITELLRIK